MVYRKSEIVIVNGMRIDRQRFANVAVDFGELFKESIFDFVHVHSVNYCTS